MDNNELANNYFTQLAYVSNENIKNTLHSATVDTEGKRSGCRNILSDDNESKRRGGGAYNDWRKKGGIYPPHLCYLSIHF